MPVNSERTICIKRKCGVDFVYLIEGCGMTRTEINDTMPHTWIVWGEYAKCVQSHNYTRNECCRIPSVLKTSTFSIRECENTFYMSAKREKRLTLQK